MESDTINRQSDKAQLDRSLVKNSNINGVLQIHSATLTNIHRFCIDRTPYSDLELRQIALIALQQGGAVFS